MKGFSSGETEQESYYEYLENIQDYEMAPLLERHYQLLIKSHIVHEFGVEFEPVIKWNELKPVSEMDRATINLNKANERAVYSNIGALDGEDIRKILIEDETSDFFGIKLDESEVYDLSEYETQDFIKKAPLLL